MFNSELLINSFIPFGTFDMVKSNTSGPFINKVFSTSSSIFEALFLTIKFSAPDPSVPNKNGPIREFIDLDTIMAAAASLKSGLHVLLFFLIYFV